MSKHDAVPSSGDAGAPHAATSSPAHVAGGAPIPYRHESGAIAMPALGALVATVLVLAVFAAALKFARRRGLLDRWIVAPRVADDGRPALRVEQSLRVGPRTTVHRVRDGERRYLLVESLAPSVRLLPIDEVSAGISHDETAR